MRKRSIASVTVFYFILFLVLLTGTQASANDLANTRVSAAEKTWYAGSADCAKDQGPALDSFALDQSTWILRQNKCQTYEAPFIYLLVGSERALLFDTGAFEDAAISPVAETVRELIAISGDSDLPLLVLNSHGHSDHTNGNAQFSNDPNTTILSSKPKNLARYLGSNGWPKTNATLDLGDREITLIATPGHHGKSITLYDNKQQLLLTGDTLYPGIILVQDWQDYRASIKRLYDFAQQNQVKYVLGGHIEMSAQPGKAYEIGSTYQPNERSLALSTEHLKQLHQKLEEGKRTTLKFDAFQVVPMNLIQHAISGIGGLIFGS